MGEKNCYCVLEKSFADGHLIRVHGIKGFFTTSVITTPVLSLQHQQCLVVDHLVFWGCVKIAAVPSCR